MPISNWQTSAKRYRLAIWPESHWWVAQCLEVDVATQAGSQAEVLDNALELLRLYFAEPCATRAPSVQGLNLKTPQGAKIVELSLEN